MKNPPPQQSHFVYCGSVVTVARIHYFDSEHLHPRLIPPSRRANSTLQILLFACLGPQLLLEIHLERVYFCPSSSHTHNGIKIHFTSNNTSIVFFFEVEPQVRRASFIVNPLWKHRVLTEYVLVIATAVSVQREFFTKQIPTPQELDLEFVVAHSRPSDYLRIATKLLSRTAKNFSFRIS